MHITTLVVVRSERKVPEAAEEVLDSVDMVSDWRPDLKSALLRAVPAPVHALTTHVTEPHTHTHSCLPVIPNDMSAYPPHPPPSPGCSLLMEAKAVAAAPVRGPLLSMVSSRRSVSLVRPEELSDAEEPLREDWVSDTQLVPVLPHTQREHYHYYYYYTEHMLQVTTTCTSRLLR